MDSERPHDIRPWAEVNAEGIAHRFLPLTEEERAMLEPLNVDERAAWLAEHQNELQGRQADITKRQLGKLARGEPT